MNVQHRLVRFRSLFLAATAGLVMTAAGCDQGGTTLEPEQQPGVAEPEGEPAAEPSAGPEGEPEGPAGESCAEATEIAPGTISGTSAGAADDHQGLCDTFSDEGSAGADVAYSFTLTERSAVNVSVTAEGTYDPILYISSADSCASDVACSDAVGAEEAFAANLEAGTYFIVIDTYVSSEEGLTEGGAFSLTLDITPPQCFDDQFDEPPTDGPAGAPSLGGLDIDTLDLDPDTPEEDSIDLFLCDAADYFLLPHMGGDLAVTVSGRDGSAAPAAELYVADEDADGELVEGAPATLGAVARGNYLLKVVPGADAAPAEGYNYRIEATHGCQPDENDAILVDEDDNTVATARSFQQATETPIAYNMCEGDEDGFVVNSIIDGDVVLTLADAAGVNVTVSTIGEEDALTPAVVDTEYTLATEGNNVVVTLTTVGRFFVLVDAGTTTGSTPYTVSAAYAAFDGPAANDTCATNGALVPSEEGVTVASYTYNGTHTIAGPLVPVEDADPVTCNGDGEVVDGSETGPAAEVFYSFSLAAPENVEFSFDGSASGFNAAMYILEFTGNTCPADLSTLSAVEVGGAPLCETGVDARIRVPDMPAGDYLLVVDGVYTPELDLGIFVFPESTTEGAFELTAKTAPGGFPVAASCAAPTTIAPPAAGTPSIDTVDRTGLPAELTGSCGGDGEELVFELVADADADLVITSGGGDNDYDTVLYVIADQCSEFGTEVICNDDDGSEEPVGNLGSRVTLSVTAGSTYFIVVDSYSAFADGDDVTANVTVSIAE